MKQERVRVAVDLLGGDHAPETVVDGVLLAVAADSAVDPILVGPPDVAAQLTTVRGCSDRFDVVPATQVVEMHEHPARAMRAKGDATVRVAARLVADGGADAVVSAGSTGATMAAALFTLGRVSGVTRPPLAVVLAGAKHPVVLLDVGSTVEAEPGLLTQYALAGTSYARVRLGLPKPRVGLLSVGREDGKGDGVRKEAYDAIGAALADLPAEFVGNVEGDDVPLGGPADVVVTDGLTGNVLLKGLEGMIARIAHGLRDHAGDDTAMQRALAEATAPFNPDVVGGAMLLGVGGVVVVGHGASSAQAVAACIGSAAQAVRDGLVEQVTGDLAEMAMAQR